MSVRTHKAAEVFFQERGSLSGPGGYTPEPRQWLWFYRVHVVPRLFKPANSGAASRDGQNWPYDGSSGTQMYGLPHLPIVLTHPDRNSGLTVQGDGVRSGSMERIPPALVRSRLR